MIHQNKYLSEVFKQPPLTAYKRQKKLRDLLIKLQVHPPQPGHPTREIKGINKCGNANTACPYVQPSKTFKIDKQDTLKIR